jgi:hypothetical protein
LLSLYQHTNHGRVWVEANSESEAKEIALGQDCELPCGEYVDDSVMVDDTVEIEVVE